MKYLEIENGRIEGWTYPMCYSDAVKFAEEVKKVCTAGSKGVGIVDTLSRNVATYFTNYKHEDGTRFVLTYNKDGQLIEIESKGIYDDDFCIVYSNYSIL